MVQRTQTLACIDGQLGIQLSSKVSICLLLMSFSLGEKVRLDLFFCSIFFLIFGSNCHYGHLKTRKCKMLPWCLIEKEIDGFGYVFLLIFYLNSKDTQSKHRKRLSSMRFRISCFLFLQRLRTDGLFFLKKCSKKQKKSQLIFSLQRTTKSKDVLKR